MSDTCMAGLTEDVSTIAVNGRAITEESFPARRQRRFNPDQQVSPIIDFSMRREDLLDFSVDMSRILERTDVVICSVAWSSDPDDLIVTKVDYAQRGVVVWLTGGTDGGYYIVTILARTMAGRVFTYRFRIRVGPYNFFSPEGYTYDKVAEDAGAGDCACYCNFFTDLCGYYVGPFFFDAADEALFTNCYPVSENPVLS